VRVSASAKRGQTSRDMVAPWIRGSNASLVMGSGASWKESVASRSHAGEAVGLGDADWLWANRATGGCLSTALADAGGVCSQAGASIGRDRNQHDWLLLLLLQILSTGKSPADSGCGCSRTSHSVRGRRRAGNADTDALLLVATRVLGPKSNIVRHECVAKFWGSQRILMPLATISHLGLKKPSIGQDHFWSVQSSYRSRVSDLKCHLSASLWALRTQTASLHPSPG
jgi:hypothetical protein